MAYFTADDIHDIVVPAVAPLKMGCKRLVIDERGAGMVVDRVIGNQERPYVDAIFVCGTTGEFRYITKEMKKVMLDAMVDACDYRVPVLFGATGKDVEETIELCQYGESHRADAIVLAPYCFMDGGSIPRVVNEVARSTSLPVYIYNYPGFRKDGNGNGENISNKNLRKILEENPNVAGIKDSSDNPDIFEGYKEVAREFGARVFMGSESRIMLSQDFVPSLANMYPELCRTFHDTASGEARMRLYGHIVDTGNAIYRGRKKERGGMKHALSLAGVCGDAVLEPGQELTKGEKAAIDVFVSDTYPREIEPYLRAAKPL